MDGVEDPCALREMLGVRMEAVRARAARPPHESGGSTSRSALVPAPVLVAHDVDGARHRDIVGAVAAEFDIQQPASGSLSRAPP